MRQPIAIILNPTAGAGAGRRVRAEIERELAARGVASSVVETTAAGDGVELARIAVRNGAETIAAVGGDGTVHEVVNGLLRESMLTGKPAPALGIIPIGTGNDFVKAVGAARDRNDAYDALARGITRTVDAGRARWDGGDEFFVNAMGTGIDVEVVRQMRRQPALAGWLVYALALVRALAVYRAIPLTATMDDETLAQRVMMIAVANGPCIGGTFRISPGARPDDGLMDVCVIETLGLAASARLALRIIRGTHEGHRAVRMRRARAVRIELAPGSPLFFQLDGELRESDSARVVTAEAVPAVLSVIVPADAAISSNAAPRRRRTSEGSGA